MKKRILVLSFDALGGADYQYMQKLPEFKEFLSKAAICDNVKSIYPSVTYACHTSIVTGKLPINHGVISNTKLQPKRVNSPDWYWQRKYIKSDTIYDAAIRSGMKVGAFLWPVTAKSKIHYVLPEIFPNRKWDHQIFTSLRNGSPFFIINLFKKYKQMLHGILQPNLDDFVAQCVVDTINSKAPEMLLVHFTDLDTARHDYGVNSKEAYEAINRLSIRFKTITDTLKNQNIYEETTIVILGDHYQLDYHTKVNLNELFADSNLLQKRNKKIVKWQAIAKSNGGSAYIYTNDNCDKLVLHEYLINLSLTQENGIETIYTSDEAASFGADKNCAFMLEAKTGYVFTDNIGGGDKGKVADHGYHPTNKENYATFYAMAGPGIKAGNVRSEMSLIDIAPTWAEFLDLSLENVDGKVVKEMFDNE